MSLFPDEDILTKEIESWGGPDEDKAVFTKLLSDCHKYSVAIDNHAQLHPFPSEPLIMSLLLTQHKLINRLKSMIESEQTQTETTSIHVNQ